jgi:hypothetical protein
MKYQMEISEGMQVSMTAAAIAAAWSQNLVHANTMVWREGLAEWTALGRLGEELGLAKKDAPRAAVPMPRVVEGTSAPPGSAPDLTAAIAAGVAEGIALERARRRQFSMGRVLVAMVIIAALFGAVMMSALLQSSDKQREIRLRMEAEEVVKKRVQFPESAQVSTGTLTPLNSEGGVEQGSVRLEGSVLMLNAFGVKLRKIWTMIFDEEDRVSYFKFLE